MVRGLVPGLRPRLHFEIDEARELGDLIFIHRHPRGTGRASGVEVRGENSYLYRVRDGKVAGVGFYAEARGGPRGRRRRSGPPEVD